MAKESPRRDRWLTFLLLPTVVVAVLVLTTGSFRASFQLEKLRERAVVDATLELAYERTQRLDQLIIEQDKVVIAESDGTDLSVIGSNWLSVAERQTPTVRAILALDLDSPTRDVLAHVSRAPGPDDADFRRLLVYKLLGELVVDKPPVDQLRHLHKAVGGKSFLLSYWQRRIAERRILFVAWHDVPRIVHDYFPVLYPERDAQSHVNIVDSAGLIVFGPPLSVGEFTVGRPFPTTLYDWRLNVALTTAKELAQRAARRRVIEIVMVSLSGLVVIAGIFVIVVAAARERKLSNLKSDFVANVSHELKTPLSLVRMFGELLQSGRVEEEDKRRQYLRIIVNESERLGILIENVLDFAKVERGKAAYEFESRVIGDSLARAVEACRLRAERQKTELRLVLPPRAIEAEIDSRAVEIATINLIDNALKYARESSEIVIELRTEGQYALVTVSDEGPGVPSEDRKRIFERFQRGSATPPGVRGSGIGLALVEHVARAHRGQAWIEAREPRGSTFIFSLKLPKRAPESELQATPTPSVSRS